LLCPEIPHGSVVGLHDFRVHQTLRVTPAMEAQLSDHVWTIEELCWMLPARVSSRRQMEKNLILKALGE
jgi:hypothetical protein